MWPPDGPERRCLAPCSSERQHVWHPFSEMNESWLGTSSSCGPLQLGLIIQIWPAYTPRRFCRSRAVRYIQITSQVACQPLTMGDRSCKIPARCLGGVRRDVHTGCTRPSSHPSGPRSPNLLHSRGQALCTVGTTAKTRIHRSATHVILDMPAQGTLPISERWILLPKASTSSMQPCRRPPDLSMRGRSIMGCLGGIQWI